MSDTVYVCPEGHAQQNKGKCKMCNKRTVTLDKWLERRKNGENHNSQKR